MSDTLLFYQVGVGICSFVALSLFLTIIIVLMCMCVRHKKKQRGKISFILASYSMHVQFHGMLISQQASILLLVDYRQFHRQGFHPVGGGERVGGGGGGAAPTSTPPPPTAIV